MPVKAAGLLPAAPVVTPTKGDLERLAALLNGGSRALRACCSAVASIIGTPLDLTTCADSTRPFGATRISISAVPDAPISDNTAGTS